MIPSMTSSKATNTNIAPSEDERFKAEIGCLVDAVFAGVRQTSLQGIDAALSIIGKEEPHLHIKAQHLAVQVMDRAHRLETEISRFLIDSKTA